MTHGRGHSGRVGWATRNVAERSGRGLAELFRSEEGTLATWGEYDLERMKRMQAYIGLRGGHNVSEQTIATFTLGGVSNTQIARTDREMLTIGLRHSRTTVLPIAAYLIRRCVMRPLRLAGYHLSKGAGTRA